MERQPLADPLVTMLTMLLLFVLLCLGYVLFAR